MYRKFLVVLILLYMHALSAKVLILTHSYNRPDFIRLQQETFKRFLLDEYEFVVFNDAPGPKLEKQIQEMCDGLGVRCIRVPQEIHQRPYLSRQPWEDGNCPSVRTANAIQYSFDTCAFAHEGIVAVIDSDMFLIRPFSIAQHLGDHDLSAVAQWRGSMGCINYIWNGIMFFNMTSLPQKRTLNFNCGSISGNHTDTGGFTHYYLQDNPDAKVLYIRDQLDLTDGDFITDSYDIEQRGYLSKEEVLRKVSSNASLMRLIEKDPDDIQFFIDFAFLHYRRAGNYHNKSHTYHRKKTDLVVEFFEKILATPEKE